MQRGQQEVLVLANSVPNSLDLLLWRITLTWTFMQYSQAPPDTKTQMASGDKMTHVETNRNNGRFCIKDPFSFPSNQQVIFRTERLYTLINHLTASISA